MKAAVLATTYTHGRTNTGAALRYVSEQMFATSNGGRDNVPNLIIILTDGGSNDKDATVTQVRPNSVVAEMTVMWPKYPF